MVESSEVRGATRIAPQLANEAQLLLLRSLPSTWVPSRMAMNLHGLSVLLDFFNAHASPYRQPQLKPSFAVYFTVSYGPARSALEDINVTLQQADHVKYAKVQKQPEDLPYSFTLAYGLESPEVMLVTPRLAEIYGAGFSKSPASNVRSDPINQMCPTRF